MSPAQTSLYFREWGKVRKHFVERGIDPKVVDYKRHELHRKALGKMKSSKNFTNADLDKVLAVFFAVTRPADLTAQLRQIEQPEQRRNEMIGACHRACYSMADLGQESLALYPQQQAYIAGVARNVVRKSLDNCSAEELAVVLGVLQRRIEQLRRRPWNATRQVPGSLADVARAAGKEPEDGNPF